MLHPQVLTHPALLLLLLPCAASLLCTPHPSLSHHRTTFTCCNERSHKKYEYKTEEPQSLSTLPNPLKVGGCDWSFTLLNDDPVEGKLTSEDNGFIHVEMLPIKGDSWIKYGPASAVW